MIEDKIDKYLVNEGTDWDLENMKEMLGKLSKDEKVKMIYMWIKQRHISLKQFQQLIEEI